MQDVTGSSPVPLTRTKKYGACPHSFLKIRNEVFIKMQYNEKDMKKLVLGVGLFFLTGCSFFTNEADVLPPPHVFLKSDSGEVIGMAVPVRGSVFVTADHLLEKFGGLYWQEEPVDIVARDFDNDLLFFRIDNWTGEDAMWSDTPPAVGEDIFWIDAQALTVLEKDRRPSLAKERVRALSQKLSEEDIRENKIVLSGAADALNAGSPVFGRTGKVFGIIIGADTQGETSFAARGDMVVKILEENMDNGQ